MLVGNGFRSRSGLHIAHFCASINPLRKFLSILLLAVFGLTVAAPLFALGNDAGTALPACCRKNGKHHCLGNMAERASGTSQGTHIDKPEQKCPFYPAANTASHLNLLAPGVSSASLASLMSDPAGVVQTESKRRISCDRSRQKRGPPSSILL